MTATSTSPAAIPATSPPPDARVQRLLPHAQWRDSESRGRAWQEMRADLALLALDRGQGLVGPIIAEAYALTSDVGEPGVDVMVEPLRLPDRVTNIAMRLTSPTQHLRVERTEQPS